MLAEGALVMKVIGEEEVSMHSRLAESRMLLELPYTVYGMKFCAIKGMAVRSRQIFCVDGCVDEERQSTSPSLRME